ncbi:hypothetical protein JCM19037_1812 [Geomicrobium sp. JCM 19037]|uniref:hypothetical protein n=1 Tax=Geomicrobium sp. JCM 19037 TaxID=1460634 RepID=UPI00045F2FC6|nr:hypothetical protein [Geomicrobium sp. JCM 19037]GAK03485.1 hypothetical protein JCM19037_1812 [Geomicrobium sp. JCM 19037]
MEKVLAIFTKSFSAIGSDGCAPDIICRNRADFTRGRIRRADHKNRRKGYPKVDPSVKDIYDEATADRLWVCSEELTGVKFFEGKTSASV